MGLGFSRGPLIDWRSRSGLGSWEFLEKWKTSDLLCSIARPKSVRILVIML